MKTRTPPATSKEGIAKAAKILGALDKNASSQLLEQIKQQQPELYQQLQDKIFTFEDLLDLPEQAVQLIVKETPQDQLLLGMKGLSNEQQMTLLRHLSQRAANMLLEDLEVLGPVKMSDVDKAQAEIIQIAQKLADNGKISLSTDDRMID